MNMVEGIQEEIKRAKELREHYAAIGPAGMFGLAVIDEAIAQGEAAIGSGDVVEIVLAYKELKSLE